MQVPCDEGPAIHIGPRVMRSGLRGPRRSVDRGVHRPAIEPRKSFVLGADAVHNVEGNMSGRDSASVRTTRRGQRPWHVQTLFARKPGDPTTDQGGTPRWSASGR